MDPYVFIPAALLILTFVVAGSFAPEKVHTIFSSIQAWIATWFGWFYVLFTLALIILTLSWAVSRWGNVRLGDDDTTPAYSLLSWLAMLFSAGMGMGLVFWGVAEPMSHFQQSPPPVPWDLDPKASAMIYAFFHWGLHPWAGFATFALGIAYFHYRKKLPLAPRSLLYPFLKDKIDGAAGRVFDTICTVGTLFGVATSLGLGAMQLNTGLQEMTSVDYSVKIQIAIIAVITLIATISVVSGISKGIRRLSLLNVGLAFLLTAIVLFLGPTMEIVQSFFRYTGLYFQMLPALSTQVGAGETLVWHKEWTYFYWGWWLSWSPFVGVFVARISRGRTIRELLLGMLFVPVLASFAWIAVYGETAFHLEAAIADFPLKEITSEPARALHVVLGYLPSGKLLGYMASLLIFVFFITSSDSGSLVDDMVTSGGHPNPPTIQRVFWATAEGLVAMTLLLAGGLKALQMVSITTGLPMAMILLLAAWGMLREQRNFRNDA